MTNMIGPMVMLAMGLIDYVVVSAWFSGEFGPEFIVWTGNLMTLIISLVASAWVAVKAVEASVSFVDGFAFEYRKGSTILGYMLGLWECVYVMMYLMWSMSVTFMAFLLAFHITEMLGERDEELNAEPLGKYGLVLG